MTVGVGVVGLASFYGPAYAERAAGQTDVTVAGVVPGDATSEQLASLGRPTPDDFATAHDCPVYDDMDALLSDDGVDAVVVASRTTRRAADAVRALRANQPVLTAKPPAATADGARSIAAAAAEAGVPAVTTSPARFDDAVKELARRVHAGTIGNVLRVHAAIRHDRVPNVGIETNAEHGPREAGSAYAMAFYTADALLWLVDAAPQRVYAEYANRNTPYSEHPDLGTATVRFEDDTLGSMTMTYAADCREPLGNWEVEVVGTDGTIRTRHEGYEGIHWHGDGAGRRTELFGRTESPILDRQFDAFVDAVRDGAKTGAVEPSPGRTTSVMELCEAWDRAAANGAVETVFG
ncbi:Gfo/Idh/MocA family protein [Halegenticoccus tardaugens]|uniref:Gfo/Idh/MocA family protein n=1 Tax=Halegenticoccus tardaugens TaxID=2071624 RepID=UPI00100AF12C|nr:Gfo/Idh/MocA family oxidoreductase [Halegenticoccus tardaugens]